MKASQKEFIDSFNKDHRNANHPEPKLQAAFFASTAGISMRWVETCFFYQIGTKKTATYQRREGLISAFRSGLKDSKSIRFEAAHRVVDYVSGSFQGIEESIFKQ